MRTTLTLDDDVARNLTDAARRTGASFTQVVNDTLRSGLQVAQKPAPALPRFRVTPRAAGFRSGIDLRQLNQLNDKLEGDRETSRLGRATGNGEGSESPRRCD